MSTPPPPPGNAAAQVADAEEVTVVATLLTALALLASALLGRHIARKTRYLATSCGVASALGLFFGGARPLLAARLHAIGNRPALSGSEARATVVALLAARLRHDGALLPRLAFDPAAFFTYLLPPIILHAGLAVEKRQFFRHLDRILLLGVLGTLANFGVIAAGVALLVGPGRLGGFRLSARDCLALGAVFGATDTVATLQVLSPAAAPALYSLVLGEGCVNDAMSLVLLRAVEALPHSADAAAADVAALALRFAYLFVCSTALGLAVGLAAAVATRFVAAPAGASTSADADEDGVALEVAVIGLLAYIAFLLAEAVHLSGILALFAAALAISHYALRRASRTGRSTTRHAFATLSLVCEQLIFVYTGLAALDRAVWRVAKLGEVITLLAVLGALLLAARAVAVAAVLALGNRLGSTPAMSVPEGAVVWWAGLMRGAVSVAIATHHFAIAAPGGVPHGPPPPPGSPAADELRTHASVVATSFLMVLLSTIGFSSGTRPFLLRVLPAVVAGAPQSGAVECAWDTDELIGGGAAPSAAHHEADEGDEGDAGGGVAWLHRAWRAADERYLAPLLGGPGGTDWEGDAAARERGAYTELLSR